MSTPSNSFSPPTPQPFVHLKRQGGKLQVQTNWPEEHWLPFLEHLPYTTQNGSQKRSYSIQPRYFRELVECFLKNRVPFEDHIKQYKDFPVELQQEITPRQHQADALTAWLKAGGRGVVCLPTGAGKTILALLCIVKVKRPTLVCVPTIELLTQWQQVCSDFFHQKIGMLGGTHHSIEDITITTYDSARIHIQKLADRFGFVVFDEAHHLGAEANLKIADQLIAPFRLGITATIERTDGGEEAIYEAVGKKVFDGNLQSMIGSGIAPFRSDTIYVQLTQEEKKDYTEARKIYTQFIKKQRVPIHLGWNQFMLAASRSREGKEALQAYFRQKKISLSCREKLIKIWEILNLHQKEHVIIFTNDNKLAYKIGMEFFLPVLTHRTKKKERSAMLEAFKKGELKALVTSRVLNEGVDVPKASVGIVVSGTASVREHVQRLGRILREEKDKQAILYELVTEGTHEVRSSFKRKQHHAYHA